jgi:hypothetical protein
MWEMGKCGDLKMWKYGNVKMNVPDLFIDLGNSACSGKRGFSHYPIFTFPHFNCYHNRRNNLGFTVGRMNDAHYRGSLSYPLYFFERQSRQIN